MLARAGKDNSIVSTCRWRGEKAWGVMEVGAVNGPNPRMAHAHRTMDPTHHAPMQNQKQTTSKLPPCLYTHMELETPSEQVAQDEFSGAVFPSPGSVLGGMVTLCPGPAVRGGS